MMVRPLSRRWLLPALFCPAAWAEERRVPVFMGDTAVTGWKSQVLELLGPSAGVVWETRTVPWPRAQALAERGEGLIFAVRRSPDREKRFVFSRTVLSLSTWALVRVGQAARWDREGLPRGLRICAARGSAYSDAMRALQGASWLESDQGDTGALRMLLAGRCDVTLITGRGADGDSAWRSMRIEGLPVDGLEALARPLSETPLHFATGHASAWREVLPALDRAIAMQKAGLDAIARASD